MPAVESELVDVCEEFLRRYYHEDIERFTATEETSIWVDYQDIFQYNTGLAEDFETHPKQIRQHLIKAADRILPEAYSPPVRVTNLPQEFDVGEYQPSELGEAIGIDGQVAQTSQCRPQLTTGVFQCLRCGTADANSVPQSGGDLQEPHECVGCERQGPFQLDQEKSDFVQSQTVRLQQPPEKTHAGASHIDIRFEGDIAGELRGGGERVSVYGDLEIKNQDETSTMFDYQLNADAFNVREGGYSDIDISEYRDEIEDIADSPDPISRLIGSLAPHISRDDTLRAIMEALILQMVGTNSKDVDSAASYRGDWHMLLLGDPGTAKSELLEEVEELAPQAKFKSGKGVSKAGMAAAAVPDDFGPSKWSLKAGLLVLANNGIACLDEIDKVDDNALDAAHTALENQRVSITKAGIDADLPSRTSLLAAGNPKNGRFDQYASIPEQIDLPPSLLSRFDLIFLLRDTPNESRDSEIADHVTDAWSDAGRLAAGEEVSDATAARDIPAETFTAYIAAARNEITPVIPDDVMDVAEERFVDLRTANGDDPDSVPVTPRKLEAILRLAESSARARFSETVTEEDIGRAYRLVRRSMQQVGVDPESGELDSDILTTGSSRQQNECKSAVESYLKQASAETSIPLNDIYADIGEFSVEEILTVLDEFKQSGDVFEPQSDEYRWSGNL